MAKKKKGKKKDRPRRSTVQQFLANRAKKDKRAQKRAKKLRKKERKAQAKLKTLQRAKSPTDGLRIEDLSEAQLAELEANSKKWQRKFKKRKETIRLSAKITRKDLDLQVTAQ